MYSFQNLNKNYIFKSVKCYVWHISRHTIITICSMWEEILTYIYILWSVNLSFLLNCKNNEYKKQQKFKVSISVSGYKQSSRNDTENITICQHIQALPVTVSIYRLKDIGYKSKCIVCRSDIYKNGARKIYNMDKKTTSGDNLQIYTLKSLKKTTHNFQTVTVNHQSIISLV